MHGKIKKFVAGILCLAVIAPFSISVYSDNEEEAAEASAEESAESDSSGEDGDSGGSSEKSSGKVITDEDAFQEMKLVTENEKLALYRAKKDKDTTLCLVNKQSGKMWWSRPVNVENSSGKKAQKKELMSGMLLTYAEPEARKTTNMRSDGNAKATITDIPNGICISYYFKDCGITVPANITLEDDHLKLHVNCSEIIEENTPDEEGNPVEKIVSEMSFMPTFGAADRDTEGYFVIPDGAGALINFNNGKVGYRIYDEKVYGDDITPVNKTAPHTTRKIMLNMFGIVEGKDGMVVVADKGDTAAELNAYVAGENKNDYNVAYFAFETRTSDKYYLGSDTKPLTVFERRGLLVPEIELRYYPVTSTDGEDVDYIDIADTYRNYLINSCGVKKSEKAESNPLYVNLYGGMLKKESVLGIPVTVKKKVTGYDDAIRILTSLNERGVSEMTVDYKDWTGTDIGEKITDSASPASVLGGAGRFKKLEEYAAANNIALYPDADNLMFRSSFGYMTLSNTAIRVSNEFSRQIVFDLAHGVENKYYKALSLFSPSSYEKAFGNLISSYNKKGIENISFGSLANTIYGDYGLKAVSREMAKGNVEQIYANADASMGSVLAEQANKYTLPYVDCVTNIPLSSSKFDLFDEEIPFYQIVLHGLIPYSTTAVNGDPDAGELILSAIASGSNLSFDMIAEEADELKDSRYDKYYYAYYDYWLDDAAGCYRLQNDILSEVAGRRIVEYNISEDGNRIETVYDDNTKTEVNFSEKTVKLNGTTYKLSDYLSEGVLGE